MAEILHIEISRKHVSVTYDLDLWPKILKIFVSHGVPIRNMYAKCHNDRLRNGWDITLWNFAKTRTNTQTHKHKNRHGHYNTSPSPYGGRGNNPHYLYMIAHANHDNPSIINQRRQCICRLHNNAMGRYKYNHNHRYRLLSALRKEYSICSEINYIRYAIFIIKSWLVTPPVDLCDCATWLDFPTTISQTGHCDVQTKYNREFMTHGILTFQ